MSQFNVGAALAGLTFVVAGVLFLLDELGQIVQVRRVDQTEALLLSSDQAWFLRENLKLRLLNARLSVLFTGVVALVMALVRQDVYELVSEASAISLVSLFVPLVAGLWLKHQPEVPAVVSMAAGSMAEASNDTSTAIRVCKKPVQPLPTMEIKMMARNPTDIRMAPMPRRRMGVISSVRPMSM